jgi:hypothetical protein
MTTLVTTDISIQRCSPTQEETGICDTGDGYKIFTYDRANSGLISHTMIYHASREHPYFGTADTGGSNTYNSMQWNEQPLRSKRRRETNFER